MSEREEVSSYPLSLGKEALIVLVVLLSWVQGAEGAAGLSHVTSPQGQRGLAMEKSYVQE